MLESFFVMYLCHKYKYIIPYLLFNSRKQKIFNDRNFIGPCIYICHIINTFLYYKLSKSLTQLLGGNLNNCYNYSFIINKIN